MYSAFTEKVGGSILDAGIAFAAFSMATGALITVIGTRPWFHLHVRTCLMVGFLVSASCDVSYVFVANKWQLFAVQIVAGLATGLIEPAWDSLFTDDIEHSSAKHWSVWAGGSHLVAGAAAAHRRPRRRLLLVHGAVPRDVRHRQLGLLRGLAHAPLMTRA